MKADDKRPIIIKRKKHGHGHHGGAWKIAFADFMTAMMALFLVLWILATSTPDQRKMVAEYFRTPLLVAMAGGNNDSASTSPIPGGGADPTKSVGEVRAIDINQESRSNIEREQLEELKRAIEDAIDLDDVLRQMKDQIVIDMIPEGLRIQLVDSEKRPMFEVGGTKVAPYMKTLLNMLGGILNKLPNSIQISGHTDSLVYANGEKGYSNWELSSDRANASRRELVSGGLDAQKLIRVSGMADKVRFNHAGEMDAINRRIAIVVVGDQARKQILDEGTLLIDGKGKTTGKVGQVPAIPAPIPEGQLKEVKLDVTPVTTVTHQSTTTTSVNGSTTTVNVKSVEVK
jgi:chemotaxis protein MotB